MRKIKLKEILIYMSISINGINVKYLIKKYLSAFLSVVLLVKINLKR